MTQSIRKPNPEISDSVFELFSMKNKVVIITGATGGIGIEVAKGLAEAGANLSLWYNSSNAAQKLADEVESKYGIKAKAYKVNIRNWEAVEATVQQTVKDFGRLDVMIANAGMVKTGDVLDQPIEDWKEIVDVDFNGVFYCARAAGRIFKEQGSGNMIVNSSISARIVNIPQKHACYNSVKAAVTHLARNLAIEWSEFARVNCVSPGYIDTPIGSKTSPDIKEKWFELTPMKRNADARELKGIFLYLASDASTFTTGSDFVIDGGYCCP